MEGDERNDKKEGRLNAQLLWRGYTCWMWGTFDSLRRATNAETMEKSYWHGHRKTQIGYTNVIWVIKCLSFSNC